MRPAPSNTNVPQWMWDSAVERYAEYKKSYDALRLVGLDDADADLYLDQLAVLQNGLEMIDPREADFIHSDHSNNIARMREAIDVIDSLVGLTGGAKHA